ncbi:hypothetical protein DSCW_18600 [Desulfosarcina widdelii]|uniref:Uncharacterized protein n=1 Tax=Desulfosarcina widdelii TaxID=947919 RepID=A0A5K7Z300_9BACT|nr:hypothetical protein [Desulfosarcina widdelii]BBO74443.1 hypothetical protein DSCW_18600 [Desulfosarcina widdelii]
MEDLRGKLREAIVRNADKAEPTIEKGHVAVGNGNIQAGGDVNISNNERKVERVNRLPECDDIDARQKKFIQDKIYQLADRDVKKGADTGKARSSWWSRLRNKFYVNSYTCLKQSQFDDVMKWLDQQVGMTRSKLRRTDKSTWRKELYTALNAKKSQLKKTKEWLYDQAYEITGKRVTSLKDLNDTNLKKLHQILFSRYKGVGSRKKIR